MTPISHPIALQKLVEAEKPTCPCTGAKFVNVRGKVLKVINNPSGVWYYLDCGVTVKADWIKRIVG